MQGKTGFILHINCSYKGRIERGKSKYYMGKISEITKVLDVGKI